MNRLAVFKTVKDSPCRLVHHRLKHCLSVRPYRSLSSFFIVLNFVFCEISAHTSEQSYLVSTQRAVALKCVSILFESINHLNLFLPNNLLCLLCLIFSVLIDFVYSLDFRLRNSNLTCRLMLLCLHYHVDDLKVIFIHLVHSMP